MISTADWDNPFWTNKQHMATRMAERGCRVLYVESVGLRRPSAGGRDLGRILRRLRKGLGGLREVRPNLWVYSPLVIPAHGSRLVRALNRMILVGSLRRFIRRLRFKRPIFWIYNPFAVELMDAFERGLLVYHCVDDLTASPGLPAQALAVAEQKLVRSADLVFTTNPQLQRTRSQWNPDHTYYLPNVVDYEHFSTARAEGAIPEDLARIPFPRIGFVGALSDYKVNFELIAKVAELRTGWHWVLIGQIGEGQPSTTVDMLNRPNIHLLGPRSYAQLPDYLRGIDVAVMPMRQNPYTESMFPMKFFEYLAAGKPVVSVPLPALEEFKEAAVIAASAEEFVAGIEKALQGGSELVDKGAAFARTHTWERRLDRMEALIGQRLDEIRSANSREAPGRLP
jgi:glycosyltransferase involved in cell wall biosynthesis